jgi:hypothetical protein
MLLPLVCMTAYLFRFKWWALLPGILYVAYRAYLGWGRWAVVVTIISLLFLYLYTSGRKWPKGRHIAFAIPVAVLFITLGVSRDLLKVALDAWLQGYELPPIDSIGDSIGIIAALDSLDFANFEYLCYVVSAIPDQTGTFSYGTQYLQLFTEPIPRVLWENKPIGQPVKLFELNDYGNFRGLTVSLPGDAWMSGGWIGLLITMVLVSRLLGWAFDAFLSRQREHGARMIYLITCPLMIQLFRDGGISIFKFLLFVLTPLLGWLVIRRTLESWKANEIRAG